MHDAAERFGESHVRARRTAGDGKGVHGGHRDVLRQAALKARNAVLPVRRALVRVARGTVFAHGPARTVAVDALVHHHAIAGPQVRNSLSALLDDADDFVAEHLGVL